MSKPVTFPAISGVRFSETNLIVSLNDGREISTPLSWYPMLASAPEKRERFEISPLGIHWPDLDEDLSLSGMLAGQNSPARSSQAVRVRPLQGSKDQKGQKWSFTRGNVLADEGPLPTELLERLHHEIETASDDR